MLKNLIFDVDDTIIRYNPKLYSDTYKNVLRKLGIDEARSEELFFAIDKYDNSLTEEHPCLNKDEMLQFINKDMHLNCDNTLIDMALRCYSDEWIRPEDVILKKETLDYFYSKYNLYVFSNYFSDTVEKRIINIGMRDYFKGIYGSDQIGTKTFEQSYRNLLQQIGSNAEECMMIGDSKKRDVLSPRKIGMQAVLIDPDGTHDRPNIVVDSYIKVNDVNELINII